MVDKKQMEIEGAERSLSNMKKELAEYPVKKAHIEMLIRHTEERLNIHNELTPLMLEGDNLTFLKPTHKFEQTPEFLALKKRLEVLNLEAQEKKLKDELDSLRRQAEQVQKEIDTLEKNIPLQEAKVKELKGD